MNLAQRLFRRSERDAQISLADWNQMFYNGLGYPLGAVQQTLAGQNEEKVGTSFQAIVEGAYAGNGVVFSCLSARQKLFSEARPKYRRFVSGSPAELWGDASLGLLENPWRGGTVGDLLARMIVHGDLAGNAFVVLRGDRGARQLRVLRPDWVVIVTGIPDRAGASEIDTEVIGYLYYEGGIGSRDPEFIDPSLMAHWAPIPDPLARFRGMSLISAVVREIEGDIGMREHKIKFLEQGATPNLAVTFSESVGQDAAKAFVDRFKAEHGGYLQAYKTVFMGAGADIKSVGADMRQLDFKTVQGAGETRIASAMGVPPIVVGLSEGLDSATYSNYGQARRAFADLTMRPLWRSAFAALAQIMPVPTGSELWYDASDISFLQEDEQDAATIAQTQANAIRSLVDAGYKPDAAVLAVTANDLGLLKGNHSGLYSVQLQPPGSATPPAAEPPSPAGE